FTPDRARSPVSILSGGERNRLLLAKLFARPANFLVLDEPTNDLDAETLELLEDLLADFKGTLLLVSHDREFLDNVVTSTLFIRPDGTVLETVGGYSDLQQELLSVKEQPIEKVVKQKQQKPKERPRKLSFKEERELEELPDRIMLLEDELQQLHNTLADPDFYRTAGDEVAIVNNRMAAVEYELQAMYSRWEELESV
ncbi:MAG: ATP-binding cassette domain-containing protein, partial [Trichlorobacter sp.]|nr:ATP-binding cassette domain-containing protein [Trichlorobacter sp.]